MLEEHKKDFEKEVYDLNPDKEDYDIKLDWDSLQSNIHINDDLKVIHTFEFDIFHLWAISSGNELVISINYLMESNNFYEKLKIPKDKFWKYSIIIQQMYNPIPYHNKTHAADVCTTCYFYMKECEFGLIGQMNDLE